MDRKARGIEEFLDLARPRTVWDLGANTGRFSRIAAARGISTVAIEADPACVEAAYLQAKADGETRLLPLWIDLFNPSPGIGWANRERFALFDRGRPDLLLALAIIHHLAIAGNLPLENLARFFPPLAPWLAIEFVSPEDPQASRLIAQHQGVHHPYDQEHFEKCFSIHYTIQRALVIAPNRRVLYLMRRRDQNGGSSTGS
jgi:ribosomal protein L11 methylase PrmA